MSGKAYLSPDCYPDGSPQQKAAVEWHRDRQQAQRMGLPWPPVRPTSVPAATTKVRHKFRAVRTDVNGRSYPSKLEASYAAELHRRKEAGEIVGWFEQVPLHLPGKTKYVLDFLIFEADGSVRAVETKGAETAVYKVKARLVAEAYPWLPIEVVKRAPRAPKPKRARKR